MHIDQDWIKSTHISNKYNLHNMILIVMLVKF